MNNQTVGDSVYMFVQYIKMTNRFLCLWFFYNACKKKAEYTLICISHFTVIIILLE